MDSAAACQKMCQDRDQCMAFTFVDPMSDNIPYRNSCCMKSTVLDKTNLEPWIHSVSGPKFCDEGRLGVRSLHIWYQSSNFTILKQKTWFV